MLFLLVLSLALYDLRTRRVPNLITLPLFAIGIVSHFPGTLPLWLGTGLLFAAWHGHALGGGDAKLWIALLWLTPTEHTTTALLVMAFALMGTALLQLAWRYLRNQPMMGVKSPSAWRALPFVVWLVLSGV
jgi:Flp pilus assembly protein protease CpaA